ncbi:heavy metal translocating P-type ATPase [Neobacillus citreus]|uniref:Cd(2+)-exporting ATPase n=1 Tax=Neobacillus citreus TaxID=2833578 RepID=A0A942T6N0_9BACI|nr:cation-translocating P-type ATPase [Neobacillus citreus]MCH6267545.1 cation-translocating P-type ATPase [Neobacillus citreus]
MVTLINKNKNKITACSFVLIVVGFLTGLPGDIEFRKIAFLLATVIASIPIFLKALQSLRMKVFSIELLVSLAVLGALYLKEYTESAVVTFLFLFGAYLEARTLEKTRSSLKELIDMAPQEATVIRGGDTIIVPIEEVGTGDRVIIRSGGRIPVDGSIVFGHASLNEAALTGESVPVTKKLSDTVYTGTIVDTGYIEMMAEKVGDDTTYAKIMELIEEAQESKTKAEKFLDKFGNIYTPVIALLAILAFVITKDLKLAITFLVIACPGALVIGAPVSSVAGIGNGAKNGALVKGGEVMDRLSKVNAIVFDKTGTLTRGKPEVTDIKVFSQLEENELLQLVAQAETISEHHLGKTIIKEALARDLSINKGAVEGEVIKGKGIRVNLEEHDLVVGNRQVMSLENIIISEEVAAYAVDQEKAGNTAIFAAIDGEISGILSIADQIRDDAKTALSELRKNGIDKIVMLTGDNRYTAAIVANKLGVDEYLAELLPEDKVDYVKKLKQEGYVVAMAGDGINDAPAIATADIGFAMGEGGTDVSMETADVVLMADRLMQLAHAHLLAKATIRNIKQNTYFAVTIVFLLLVGVLFGSVHLASGMFIHEASVLLVILNAMRLVRFNPGKIKVNSMTQLAPGLLK